MRVVWVIGAILSIGEAVFPFEIGLTLLAVPNDVSRRHENTPSKHLVHSREIRNEVQGLVVRLGEPHVILHPVVWSGDIELGDDGDLCQILLRGSKHKVN
jgi:hypothetical protein